MFSQRESCRTCVIIDLKDVFFWELNGTHYNIRFILAQVCSLCISRSSCVIQFNSEFNTSRTILTSDPQPTRVCVSVCVCAEMTGSTETHYSCALSRWFMCRLQPLLQKHRQRAAVGKLSIGECFYLCVCVCACTCKQKWKSESVWMELHLTGLCTCKEESLICADKQIAWKICNANTDGIHYGEKKKYFLFVCFLNVSLWLLHNHVPKETYAIDSARCNDKLKQIMICQGFIILWAWVSLIKRVLLD